MIDNECMTNALLPGWPLSSPVARLSQRESEASYVDANAWRAGDVSRETD